MASLTAHLKLDRSGFAAGLKGAQKSINAFARSARAAVTTGANIAMGVAGVGAAVGGIMAVGVKKALDLGGSLNDLAAQTGLAAGSALVLQQAFKNSGVDAEKLRPTINRLQKTITEANAGNASARQGFSALGLEWGRLAKLAPDKQFAQVSSAIANIKDPAQRAAAAMGIFGKSGGELLALFKDPQALTQAQREIGKAADVMSAKAPIFDDISDKIANMVPAKLSGLFIGITDALSGPLLALLQRIEGTDLLSSGQQIGKWVIQAAQFAVNSFYTVRSLIMDGRQGFAQIIAWGADLVNLIWDGLTRIGNLIQTISSGTIYIAKKLVAGLADGLVDIYLDLETGFKFAFQSVARFFSSTMGPIIDAISAGLEFAIQNVMAGIAKIPILNEKLGLKGFRASSYDDILKSRKADRAPSLAPVRPFAEMRAESLKNSPWLQFGKEVSKIIDASAEPDRQNRIAAFSRATQIAPIEPLIDKAPLIENIGIQTAARDAYRASSASEKRFSIEPLVQTLGGEQPESKQPLSEWARLQASKFGDATKQSLGDSPSLSAPKEWARLQSTNFGDSTRARFGDSPSLLTHTQIGLEAGSRPGSYKLQGGLIGNSEAARKAEAERAAAVERDKDKTPEGTNARLDDLINIVETAWG